MTSGERGAALVEVLFAAAVIGVGVIGLAVVVPVASYGVQEGNQLSTATFLAEQRLEQVRIATWAALPAADCLGVSPGDAAPAGSTGCARPGAPGLVACVAGAACTTFPDETTVPGFGGYAWTTRVTDCEAAPGCGAPHAVRDPALRRVRVAVTYRPLTAAGASPTPKTVALEWLVARR